VSQQERVLESEEVAIELGEAMKTSAFQRMLEILEGYELRVLAASVDDPEMTKDYVRGFVHCIRALRSDMEAARNYVLSLDRSAEREEKRKKEGVRSFMPPGSGPGGPS
jgi:hypothetical protein